MYIKPAEGLLGHHIISIQASLISYLGLLGLLRSSILRKSALYKCHGGILANRSIAKETAALGSVPRVIVSAASLERARMSNCNSASLIHGCCCAEDVLRSNLMDIDRPAMARRCGSSPAPVDYYCHQIESNH